MKIERFVKVTSLCCHEVTAPDDVFPRGSSVSIATDVRIYNWRYWEITPSITGDIGI